MGNKAALHGFSEQCAGGLVQIEIEGLGGWEPSEYFGLVVEHHIRAAGAGGVVEQDEMVQQIFHHQTELNRSPK